MTIPDEAVEAAAKAEYEDEFSAHNKLWADAPLWEQELFRHAARAALTAAAPFIAAQAWDEGEDAGYKNCNSDQWGTLTVKNPYRSVWTMTDTELNEELRRAKEQAWDAGWNAGMRFESPKNPYRSGQ